jgi:putative transposase
MYNYRSMSPAERERLLDYRRTHNLPWHSPPHRTLGFTSQYFVTAACYEHAAIIGKSPERLTECEQQILDACAQQASQIYGWCVLPNHYHVLLNCLDLSALTQALGRFHGWSSFRWNAEDGARGRKVWFRCFDREIRSERHFWATMNYIHHNPVHHGLVDKWQDWIWSSAGNFLESVGRQRANEIWQEYPILDYGKKWDI